MEASRLTSWRPSASSNALFVPVAVVVPALLYLVVTGWSMFNLSYDIWSVLIILPLVFGVGVWALRRVFVGEQQQLLPIAIVGLVAKVAGAFVRYWVAFDAYGGASDAVRYHEAGSMLAAEVRSGELSPTALIPRSIGTPFIEHVTGIVYTVFGSGRLAGFVLFSCLAFCGLVLFVKAGIAGVPGLDARRYALLCLLMPSLLFWPSSIGKEAWMCFALGLASWGCARTVGALSGRWRGFARLLVRSLAALAIGLAAAALARPHVAAIWTGGVAVGLLMALVVGIAGRSVARRVTNVLLLGAAVVGFVVVGTIAVRYLDPSDEDQSVATRIEAIFDETSRRSGAGGSAIEPVSISSPTDWPYAIERTLLRPSPTEIHSASTALPGIESLLLLVLLAVVGWRRLLSLPGLIVRSPYLVAALVTVAGFGLAFSTIGNLGILVRQRSLVFPLMLLLWALPLPHRAIDEEGV